MASNLPQVPLLPADLFSRTQKQIAAWVLTKAEYASIDFYDCRRTMPETAQDFAIETAALLLMVLARIGVQVPDTPNLSESHFDLMIIRGHIRELFGWRGGPKHSEDFSYGQ